jgi:hypothetical protein
MQDMRRTSAFVIAIIITAACSNTESKPVPAAAPGPTPAVQRTPIGDLPDVDTDAVLDHIKTLSWATKRKN